MRLALAFVLAFAASQAFAQGLGNGPLPAGGFAAPVAQPPPQAEPAAPPAPRSDAAPKPRPQAAKPKPRPARAADPIQTGSLPTATPRSQPDQALPAAAAPMLKAKPKPQLASLPAPNHKERVVAKNDPRPTFHPAALQLMQEAAIRYRAAAERGGWPILPAGTSLRSGSDGDAVLMLRERLAFEGDLVSHATGNPRFDGELAAAVRNFQGRHGFKQDGIVGGLTLRALRVSTADRAEQLEQSVKRLAPKAGFAFGPRYVVVNIPSASVEAIADGQVERRHIAVVGKPERASPQVSARISNVNFNPTWTVPVSIIKKDIIPKMQKDPQYLAKSKIRIFGASGVEIDPAKIDWTTERATAFTLRQDPGAGNSLGQVRIDMPNREAVYMHDTPSKRLFLRDDRFHSSGCVRVENVRGLVEWLLKPVPHGTNGWDQQAIAEAIDAGQRRDVRLKEAVPVIWTYLTGYVTPDGQVHFRDDVYGLDDGRPAAEALDAIARETSQPPAAAPRPRRDVNAALTPEPEARGPRVQYARPGAPVQRIDP